MNCPFCLHADTKVLDSRPDAEGRSVRRRRECLHCEKRWRTVERVEDEMPLVIKRDGSHEAFDRNKIRASVEVACGKRPVSPTQIEKALADIEWSLLQNGEPSVKSSELGLKVMHALKGLDEIAYVRFASVYRRFQDAAELMLELRGLLDENRS